MSDHRCFTAAPTAYMRSFDRESGGEAWAVLYQAPPESNGDGTTSYSLNFPTLIVTAYLSEPQKIAERVARILNEHWDDREAEADG